MRGKVVLITDAHSEIGAATAVLLASQGCLLTLTGKIQERLWNTKQDCLKMGVNEQYILVFPTDLQVQENLTDIVDKTVQKFGRLDVLVNIAECPLDSNLLNTTWDDYDSVMNTNVRAMFFLTQTVLPHLIQSKGNVVNVSSYVSQRPHSSIVYAMSKAAVDHFTRTAALDLADKNVRVNAVNPGYEWTKRFPEMGFTDDTYVKGTILSQAVQIGVENIASAIAFLADKKESSFVTGVTLFVEGGIALKGPV